MAKKILVGEDNLVTQQVLKAMLENRYFEVTLASTSEEIITQLENDSFSLLLLDFHLDQDADEVVKQIRSLTTKNKSIPIYILSAEREKDVMQRLQSHDISGYIKKPVDNNQLDQILVGHQPPTVRKSNEEFIESLIGDNKDRINTINHFFAEEVPPALQKIAKHLEEKDFQAARSLVHRIRPAFTYIGRDDVQKKLELWETDLLEGINDDSNFDILNETIVHTESILAAFPTSNLSKTGILETTSDANAERLRGLKILIVDDNKVFQSVFTSFLKTHGMEVISAMDGLEAVSKTSERQPDLILMDLHMPVMSGVEAIAQIRSQSIATPIIAISNITALKSEAIASGANSFLLKPISAEDLLRSISDHII